MGGGTQFGGLGLAHGTTDGRATQSALIDFCFEESTFLPSGWRLCVTTNVLTKGRQAMRCSLCVKLIPGSLLSHALPLHWLPGPQHLSARTFLPRASCSGFGRKEGVVDRSSR